MTSSSVSARTPIQQIPTARQGWPARHLASLVALAAGAQLLADPLRVPTTEAVRLALDTIDADYPEGLALPLAVLREQVAQTYAQHLACHPGSGRWRSPRPG